MLGAILAGHGLSSPERGVPVRMISIVLGAGCLWQAWRHLTTAKSGIVLTEDGLFESSGELICGLDNIGSVGPRDVRVQAHQRFPDQAASAGRFSLDSRPLLAGRQTGRCRRCNAVGLEAKVMADSLKILVDERFHRS